MGYCPQVERAGNSLYLPVPLTSRNVSIGNRVTLVDSPIDDGSIALNNLIASGSITLSGSIIVNNPQNVCSITTESEMWMYAVRLGNFFLKNSSIPFTLVLAEVGAVMGGGTEYPPLGTDVVYERCFATGFSLDYNSASTFYIDYSVTLTLPVRGV